jgi:phosphodiesterase/alkaline phosphatase D-like protein
MTIKKYKSSRRKFMQVMASLPPAFVLAGKSLAADETGGKDRSWNAGNINHLIPIASHDQVLIKTSFKSLLKETPVLKMGGQFVKGIRSDTRGYFWEFYVNGLNGNTEYTLQLLSNSKVALSDPWPLKTFPKPDEKIEKCRILVYTCAGGNEDILLEDGTRFFLPIASRQRLLERGLAFQPDLVIANGDHIYWDQITLLNKSGPLVEAWHEIYKKIGTMDRNIPVLGTDNEEVLKRIVDPQIAQLYGTRLRSTPTYMLTDDHDLFENDEASDEFISLPPSQHSLEAARATQHLYYPEFLEDATRPDSLSGSSASDRISGLSEVFGTIRYGNLLEALLYDTKRYVSLNGAKAGMVPDAVEKWLINRTVSEETSQLMHVPSTPIGWSAGKWGEWYPDILQKDRTLGTNKAKPYWPSGWWQQHQRILTALSAQKKRSPLIINGDLHNFAAGKIIKSGDLDLRHNPVNTVCVGPLGSAGPLFPSTSFRATGALVPSALELDEHLKPLEKNGFTIIDVSPDKMKFQLFAWRPPEELDLIDTMKPISTFEVSRNA